MRRVLEHDKQWETVAAPHLLGVLGDPVLHHCRTRLCPVVHSDGREAKVRVLVADDRVLAGARLELSFQELRHRARDRALSTCVAPRTARNAAEQAGGRVVIEAEPLQGIPIIMACHGAASSISRTRSRNLAEAVTPTARGRGIEQMIAASGVTAS